MMTKLYPLESLLTVDDVARLTGWAPGTIRGKVFRHELEYLKLGRSVRFRAETIAKLLESAVVPARENR